MRPASTVASPSGPRLARSTSEPMAPDDKTLGAYYTPEAVADALVRWAVRDAADSLLDPSSGDGRFVARHPNSVGVERDPASAAESRGRAPKATIVEGDFFTWAAADRRRFDCAAGNPPFIRYQRFAGATRRGALDYCRRLGVVFSGLSSSWAPFIVAAASKLRPGGRMAFVVPAEIGHAPYAGPLMEYLVGNFGSVHLVAIKDKIFPKLSEDCWLLLADRAGSRSGTIRLSRVERFDPRAMPPPVSEEVSVEAWRVRWRRRLRPFLLPAGVRNLYEGLTAEADVVRLGQDCPGRHRVRQRGQQDSFICARPSCSVSRYPTSFSCRPSATAVTSPAPWSTTSMSSAGSRRTSRCSCCTSPPARRFRARSGRIWTRRRQGRPGPPTSAATGRPGTPCPTSGGQRSS